MSNSRKPELPPAIREIALKSARQVTHELMEGATLTDYKTDTLWNRLNESIGFEAEGITFTIVISRAIEPEPNKG